MKIGFIDYSREERNRILSTLRMLEEKTALDYYCPQRRISLIPRWKK